ncbi:MAG TPA: alpha/beta hydrolase [Opitutaceae bacterium]|nr:alpha/beta hydrolase [Opitutaceae bacterium]
MKLHPAFLAAAAFACSLPAAEIQKDIPYGSAGGIELKLDARIPDGPGPFPALVIVHGGGWSGGSKSDPREVGPILDPLTDAGIAWFSVNYRLSRQARYPACIEDVESAVQFVKRHAAEFRVDPAKVAISGDSAGGHIVDMVAVRASPDHPERRLAGVVSFYGPNDLVEDSFRRNGPSPSLQALFGLPPKILNGPTVKLLQSASPLAYLSADLPPFLLLHGTADQSVDYPGSVILKADLDAIGVPCELITIPGGVHVMWNWDHMKPPQTAYKQQMIRWLKALFARPERPAPPRPRVDPARLAGKWAKAKAPAGAAVILAADGTGRSLVEPACPIGWTFDPAANAVHIDYPERQGRDVPYAGSPDLSTLARNKIEAAGPRPTVGFADWRYFPGPDVFVSSNGEIFRRQAN